MRLVVISLLLAIAATSAALVRVHPSNSAMNAFVGDILFA